MQLRGTTHGKGKGKTLLRVATAMRVVAMSAMMPERMPERTFLAELALLARGASTAPALVACEGTARVACRVMAMRVGGEAPRSRELAACDGLELAVHPSRLHVAAQLKVRQEASYDWASCGMLPPCELVAVAMLRVT